MLLMTAQGCDSFAPSLSVHPHLIRSTCTLLRSTTICTSLLDLLVQPGLIMAPIPRPSPQRFLEDLEGEFTLDSEELLSITQQFLDDFAKGLGEYGQPMAMMYDSSCAHGNFG
jgi:hypothetical protein